MASLHTLTEKFLIENKTLPSLHKDLKEEVEAWVGISTNINVSGHPKPGARKDADRPERRNSWPRPWAKKSPRTRIGSLTKTSRGPDMSFGSLALARHTGKMTCPFGSRDAPQKS